MTAWAAVAQQGMSALRRSAIWWGVGVGALCATTAGFWPSLEGSEALDAFGEEEMGSLLEAFGAQNMATAAGYLDGQMYALMLPLLLSGMAIAHVTALTSGDEDAGRLEFLHALPISREAVWLARWLAATMVLVCISAAIAIVMLIARPLFSLGDVSPTRLVIATMGCALLALFHAAVGYAASGAGVRRSGAVAASVCVLVLGYVLAFLVPLVEGLAWARRASPWYWALGRQPVSDGVDTLAWLLLIVGIAGALVIGSTRLCRRDLHSA
jgi:ABC-2 type transport system permease protein